MLYSVRGCIGVNGDFEGIFHYVYLVKLEGIVVEPKNYLFSAPLFFTLPLTKWKNFFFI